MKLIHCIPPFQICRSAMSHGTGTYSKVEGTQISCRTPTLFDSKSIISQLGECIHDGQYSLVSFLYEVFLLSVPPVPSQCKSGGHVPPHLDMESALLALTVMALKS